MEKRTKFIYADLQKMPDKEGEIWLTTLGTKKDLERYGLTLEESQTYWFWRDCKKDDPLVFQAEVHYDHQQEIWIAELDTSTLKLLSESEFAGKYTSEEIQGR